MLQSIEERLLAGVAHYLADEEKDMAARVLLECTLTIKDRGDLQIPMGFRYHNNGVKEPISIVTRRVYDITLTAPKFVYDILSDSSHPITQEIRDAFTELIPTDTFPVKVDNFNICRELPAVDPDWRIELRDALRNAQISNQGVVQSSQQFRTWNGLRFRSQSEIRIAEALDRAGVLFLPNCRARLGPGGARKNREADFLVCTNGKWGILEVDGESFHPATRTVHDHERDRLFKTHGIRVVEHYDADSCYNHPDHVVEQFLTMLAQA